MSAMKIETMAESVSPSALKVLQPSDIQRIEEALNKVGLFGEIRLITVDGRLGYICTLTSEPVDKISIPQ